MNNNNILRLIISLSIIAGGFVTYKMWPLRERVSIAEQKIQTIQDYQEEIKDELDERPIEKQLNPVFSSLQRQLDEHNEICKQLQASVTELEKLMAKIEEKL